MWHVYIFDKETALKGDYRYWGSVPFLAQWFAFIAADPITFWPSILVFFLSPAEGDVELLSAVPVWWKMEGKFHCRRVAPLHGPLSLPQGCA